MATTQYIGARYVPLFAEPIEWDKTKQYEPLTIVTHNGNSYTSRQFVPTGIEITNETFWALTGNFNAQVEQYRKEVTAYDGRITTAQTTAENAKSLAETNERDIAANNAELAGTADSGLKTMITEETTRAGAAETALGTRINTANTNIANLDAQMEATTGSELLNKITKNASDITNINNNLNGDYLLIGDSYMAGWTPDGNVTSFGDKFKTAIESTSNSKVHVVAVGGAGFSRSGENRWSTIIKNYIDSLTAAQKLNIKKVYICGGFNDIYGDSNSIATGISEAIENLAVLKNAKTSVLFMAHVINGKYQSNTEATLTKLAQTYNTYLYNASIYNYAFKDCFGVLHYEGYLSSDTVHPNEAGQNWLFQSLVNIDQGGSAVTFIPLDQKMKIAEDKNVTLSPVNQMDGSINAITEWRFVSIDDINVTTDSAIDGNTANRLYVKFFKTDEAKCVCNTLDGFALCETIPCLVSKDNKYYNAAVRLVRNNYEIGAICTFSNADYTNYLTAPFTLQFNV